MAHITLQEGKAHLRVDFDSDDSYIVSLISLVEELVTVEIGDDLPDPLPKGLRQAMLLMLAHFYEVREPIVIGAAVVKIPYAYDYLIAPYKTYTIQ